MKKLISLLLAVVLMLGAMGGAQGRSEASAVEPAASPAVTNNQNHWEYWTWQNWSQPVRSYLYDNGDGSVTRVEYTGSAVAVEVYDASRSIVSSRTIEPELPLFGGFFAGSEYNFLVFGQENPDESDEQEVVRTVKYSKSWTRLGSASLYGENTYAPFEAASLRVVEYGGYLVVRTGHKMYASNGLRHQANMTYVLNIASMQIEECCSGVVSWGGYCSHSFNQFVAVDGDKLIALDHGDAYPRCALLTRFSAAIGDSVLHSSNQRVATVAYPGSTGNNYTYSCIGGLEVTSRGYMTVGNTNGSTEASEPRNVYLTVTDRDDFTANGTRTVWLTSFTSSNTGTVSNPQLVKITDDRLMVLWKENGTVKYVFVDGSGELLSDIAEAPGYKVSDCLPIVIGDTVEWYVTSSSAPVFYTLSASSSLTGDVDGDGAVTMADVTLLSMYLNGEDPVITGQGMADADANEDGTVDIRDIAAIYAIIAAS